MRAHLRGAGLVLLFGGQSLASAPPAGAQVADGSLLVCVDREGLLRVAAASGCPPEQRAMALALADFPAEDASDRERGGCDERRLAELEQRLRNLEAAPRGSSMGSRAVAPFEVVNRSGQRVFQVEEGWVRVYHPGRDAPAAGIRASEYGGHFMGASATDRDLYAAVGVLGGDRAGVFINEGKALRIDLGRTENQTWAARFMNERGQVVAGIGQSQAGSGLALVADSQGYTRARMQVVEGKGSIEVTDVSDTTLALLGEGITGGGVLRLFDSGGTPMVAAGVHPEGFGLVKTGPASFATDALLGLPGSYIMGKP